MRARLLLTALLFTVAGCTDKKAATKGNFKDSLNEYLSYAKTCAVYDAAFSMLPSAPMPDNFGYDPLVKSGMLSKSPAPSAGTVPFFVYDLTTKGKATKTTARFADRLVTGYLCTGNQEVDQVLRFTEPADERGKHESEVTFTLKPVPIPDWSKATYPQAAQKADVNNTREVRMVLTSEGWKVDGTMTQASNDH